MNVFYQTLKIYFKLVLGRGSFRSYGQNGEDAVAHALLHSLNKGIYVDVGAYHPTLYSNTYALYRRGWRGVVIDPNTDMQKLFGAVRPRDIFVHAGVARVAETKTYYRFSDGAYNTFDVKEADERKAASYPRFVGESQVAVRPLADILREKGITRVDFLNIDVEGMDIEALESYDWSLPPRVIAIESRSFNPDTPMDDLAYRFLRGKGYVLDGLAAYTLLFIRADA